MSRCYDVIGDVHGRRRTLERLLESLDYVRDDGGWAPPAGRHAVFVGDLVDKGPDPLGALEIALRMRAAGHATLVLGNHELNLLHLTAGLRDDTPTHRRQARTSLAQIEADSARWAACAAELRTVPFYATLDEGHLRVVHAAWDDDALGQLPANLRRDGDLLATAGGGPLRDAAERCLKGPEHACAPFEDAYGHARSQCRTPWWRDYDAHAPAITFGHYAFPWSEPGHPVDEPTWLGDGLNATCLDFGAGHGGPLVAMQWPERTFVQVRGHSAKPPAEPELAPL